MGYPSQSPAAITYQINLEVILMKLSVLTLLAIVLSGCASTADINLRQLDSKCAQACTKNYSECLGQFTLFPIQAQHQCTDALRLCAQTCPVNKSLI
jgi:hypothetical protein